MQHVWRSAPRPYSYHCAEGGEGRGRKKRSSERTGTGWVRMRAMRQTVSQRDSSVLMHLPSAREERLQAEMNRKQPWQQPSQRPTSNAQGAGGGRPHRSVRAARRHMLQVLVSRR
jgi:hypothetical protein